MSGGEIAYVEAYDYGTLGGVLNGDKSNWGVRVLPPNGGEKWYVHFYGEDREAAEDIARDLDRYIHACVIAATPTPKVEDSVVEVATCGYCGNFIWSTDDHKYCDGIGPSGHDRHEEVRGER